MRVLFSEGYKSLLEFYLSYSDQMMVKYSKKLNLINMKTHERIRKIILLRLKINEKEKKFIRRTIYTLMLPHHSRISIISLYNTINQIWYLAGDNSADFNFYTKRVILAGVYSSTFLYWINSNTRTFSETKNFLEKKLNNVNKIPKFKRQFKSIYEFSPKIFSFVKNFSEFKQ